MTRIYTRAGDSGETSLIGGVRVLKNNLRVETYGNLDELNSVIGAALTKIKDQEIRTILEQIQNELFNIGAKIANPKDKLAIKPEKINSIEKIIDKFDRRLLPLKTFILPGGGEAGSLLHITRTSCRRCERSLIAFLKKEGIKTNLPAYLNRLADLLFVLARYSNFLEKKKEKSWVKDADL